MPLTVLAPFCLQHTLAAAHSDPTFAVAVTAVAAAVSGVLYALRGAHS